MYRTLSDRDVSGGQGKEQQREGSEMPGTYDIREYKEIRYQYCPPTTVVSRNTLWSNTKDSTLYAVMFSLILLLIAVL